ncbi:oligosaccharide flippase family protein [Candidatus Peregrinibacteria bacterium]|nr:oligosaccharide flippase family protein [Candidatus Peregrinibacteria bacterium]
MENQQKKNELRLFYRSIQGAKWVTFSNLTIKLINLVSIAVLARLIVPAQYGIASTIFFIIGVFETFTEPGLERAFIQSKERESSLMNSIWTFNIFRGIFTYLLVYLSAPFIADFFSISDSVFLLRAASIYLIIWGFRSIGLSALFKDLKFKQFYFYDLIRQLAFFFAAFLWALFQPTATALIVGHLTLYTSSVIVVYFLDDFRPKFDFHFYNLKKLTGYSKWVVGYNLLNYLNGILDSSFIAHRLGPTPLAFYNKAQDIARVPSSFTDQIISKVAFPIYAKIVDSRESVREGYMKTYEFVLVISAPFFISIFFFSEKIISILLGKNWLQTAPLLKILIFAIILKSLVNTTFPLFDGIGYPNIRFKSTFIQLTSSFFLFLYLIPQYGVLGASYGLLVSSFLVFFYSIFQSQRLIRLPLWRYFLVILIVCAASFLTMLLGWPMYSFLQASNSFQFILFMIVFGLLYLIFVYIFGSLFRSGPYHTIKAVFRNLR